MGLLSTGWKARKAESVVSRDTESKRAPGNSRVNAQEFRRAKKPQ